MFLKKGTNFPFERRNIGKRKENIRKSELKQLQAFKSADDNAYESCKTKKNVQKLKKLFCFHRFSVMKSFERNVKKSL